MKGNMKNPKCSLAGSPAARASSCFIPHSAFTLVEVMIAMFIFFMAVFTILGVISNALRNARMLQRKTVDAGMVAAQISLTNRLTEQLETGDFGDMYPDCEWTRDIYEVATNSLFQVDILVQRKSGNSPIESKTAILLYRPGSPPGGLTRPGGPR